MIGDRYALEREVGRGGMGAVWLARDRMLGRDVAIKRVGADPGDSTPDNVRVEREARIAAQVNHPNVVAVFDLVEHDGQHWLVMEYVAGTTLAEMIRRHGRIEPDRAAPLFAQTAAALADAHAAGIVHRDVKPSNILVGEDGHVKLSDFGIARGERDAALTATGLVTGSPGYIAPEVAQGRGATTASDVWSLGATAYHVLAGHPPYEVGENVIATLYRIVNEEPPRLDREMWLEPFVTAAMNRDPDRRWTMSEVTEFLESAGRRGPGAPVEPIPRTPSRGTAPPEPTEPMSTVPPRHVAGPSRRGRGWWPVAALVAVLGLLTFTGWALMTGGDAPPPSAGSTSSAPSSAGGTDSGQPSPRREMAGFVRQYLEQADTAPEEAWSRLTREYQQESGGLDGYLGFWRGVSNVRDIEIRNVDPDRMTVTYAYTYDLQAEGRQDDTVRLNLVQPSPDSGYLISGAETLD